MSRSFVFAAEERAFDTWSSLPPYAASLKQLGDVIPSTEMSKRLVRGLFAEAIPLLDDAPSWFEHRRTQEFFGVILDRKASAKHIDRFVHPGAFHAIIILLSGSASVHTGDVNHSVYTTEFANKGFVVCKKKVVLQTGDKIVLCGTKRFLFFPLVDETSVAVFLLAK